MKINSIKIGRKFEKEAYEILKKKFDEVEWLSKNKSSPLDFKCIKDGKVFYGDAKFISIEAKPVLSNSQRDASFLICNINGKIKFIWKDEFNEKVIFGKAGITKIQISEKQWSKMNKHKRPRETFEEVLGRMIKVIESHKFWSEVDELK